VRPAGRREFLTVFSAPDTCNIGSGYKGANQMMGKNDSNRAAAMTAQAREMEVSDRHSVVVGSDDLFSSHEQAMSSSPN